MYFQHHIIQRTRTITYFRPGRYIVTLTPRDHADRFRMTQVDSGKPFDLKIDDIVEYKGCTYDPSHYKMTRYFDFNGLLLKSEYLWTQSHLQRCE